MILDETTHKTLYFSISLAGVDINNIQGLFKIYLQDSVVLGFSTVVDNGKLRVKIPPLQGIVSMDFDEGQEFKAELSVVAKQDAYSIPWSGTIKIKKSVSIEASISKEVKDNTIILVGKPTVR